MRRTQEACGAEVMMADIAANCGTCEINAYNNDCINRC